MTQEEIAAALGVPRPTYANAEAGRQRVTVDFLWKAAVVLGVPLQKLVPEPLASLPLWAEPVDPVTGAAPTSFGYILPHESPKRTSGSGAA
jgi:transcriptional regulator with XRE-family HTH domain